MSPPGWAVGLFKKIADGTAPSKKVYEDKNVVAFLDISPLSKGHTLVIPRKEIAFLDQMDEDTAAAIGRVLPRIGRAVMSATGAKHFNILQNNGSLAHQVVPHVHFHVIPKFSQDDGLVLKWNAGSINDFDSESLVKKMRSALTSNGESMTSVGEVELIYFPIAGRGELTRLIAAAGGIKLRDSFSKDWKRESLDLGFFGNLPILKHGSFKLTQSGAIERYVSSLSPKFDCMSLQTRSIDDMFAATKEDIVVGCAKVLFGNEEAKAQAKKSIPAVLDKFLDPIEKMLPASGFTNGMPYPTTADLALLNIVECEVPVGKAIEIAGGYNFNKFPKIMAIVNATKKSEGVKEYLAATKSLKGSL